MDRQQALAELQELKKRADALEAIINAPEVPEVFAGVSLVPIESQSYFIDTNGLIFKSHWRLDTDAHVLSGQLFPTEESAKKAAKLAQLQVKLFRAMAASWGESRVPWDKESVTKWAVVSSTQGHGYRVDQLYRVFSPIAFKTQEDLTSFVKDVTPKGIVFLLQGMQYEGTPLW